MDRRQLLAGGAGLALAGPMVAQSARAAGLDYDSLTKIRTEGITASSSKVMETASYMMDVMGPRLTGSPGAQKSGEWVVSKMKGWGMESALEPWPTDPAGQNNGFPRGWQNEKFYLQATSPLKFPISGMSVGWSPGTNGPVSGECVLVTETTEAELKAKWGGKLKGKWILTQQPLDVRAQWDPVARRYTREQLDNMETPPRGPEFGTVTPGANAAAAPRTPAATPVPVTFNRTNFFRDEGALGTFATNKGQGVVNVLGGARNLDPKDMLPAINLEAEHYGRIARSLKAGVPVVVEADIVNTYAPNPMMFNVVAEIKGKEKPDEVVIVGGHFDSFHAATGATDNGCNCAVAMEALRILKTTGVPLARTVRMCLWTGEEQGLIGSRLYVREHFGGARTTPAGTAATPIPPTPPTPAKPAHPKFQAYFNLDNGTGAARGIYLQNNLAIGPIFRQWMEPLRNLGMTHINPGNTTGTDHQSFDAANLPGFQFIQDQIDYEPKTHHTNMDFYESLQPEDMRRNAVILASFAFLASNWPDRLPRKAADPPVPAPAPPAAAPARGRRR